MVCIVPVGSAFVLVYPSSPDFLCWVCSCKPVVEDPALDRVWLSVSQQFPPEVVFLTRARPGVHQELVAVLPCSFESGVLHSPIGPDTELAILCVSDPLGTVLGRSAPVDLPFLGNDAERPEQTLLSLAGPFRPGIRRCPELVSMLSFPFVAAGFRQGFGWYGCRVVHALAQRAMSQCAEGEGGTYVICAWDNVCLFPI